MVQNCKEVSKRQLGIFDYFPDESLPDKSYFEDLSRVLYSVFESAVTSVTLSKMYGLRNESDIPDELFLEIVIATRKRFRVSKISDNSENPFWSSNEFLGLLSLDKRSEFSKLIKIKQEDRLILNRYFWGSALKTRMRARKTLPVCKILKSGFKIDSMKLAQISAFAKYERKNKAIFNCEWIICLRMVLNDFQRKFVIKNILLKGNVLTVDKEPPKEEIELNAMISPSFFY